MHFVAVESCGEDDCSSESEDTGEEDEEIGDRKMPEEDTEMPEDHSSPPAVLCGPRFLPGCCRTLSDCGSCLLNISKVKDDEDSARMSKHKKNSTVNDDVALARKALNILKVFQVILLVV